MKQSASKSQEAYLEFLRYYEKFIEVVSTSLSEKEIAEAKEEFFDLSGRVTEMDASMELRYGWFVEYLVFEYKRSGKSPAQEFLILNKNLTDLEMGIFRGLTDYNNGLFMIKSVNGDRAKLFDLFNDNTFSAFIPPSGIVFEKKGIYQGKVFPFNAGEFISPVGIFHPEYLSRLVIKVFKQKIKGDDVRYREFFWMLARLKLKQERFARVPPIEIYKQVLENESSWIFKIN